MVVVLPKGLLLGSGAVLVGVLPPAELSGRGGGGGAGPGPAGSGGLYLQF